MTTETLSEPEFALDRVGAKVLIVGRHERQTEATVTKVGRKWSTATTDTGWPREWQFDKVTGAGKSERDGFAASFAVYTPEGWEEHTRRTILTTRLREATRPWGWVNGLTNEQIAAVLAIIAPEPSA